MKAKDFVQKKFKHAVCESMVYTDINKAFAIFVNQYSNESIAYGKTKSNAWANAKKKIIESE